MPMIFLCVLQLRMQNFATQGAFKITVQIVKKKRNGILLCIIILKKGYFKSVLWNKLILR